MAEIDARTIRARRFSVARKGYDRSEVEAYLDELAGAVERVHHRLAGLEAQFEQLGIQEPTDLAAELETIGDEVAAVLGQARAAAEAMRRRASEDAARWRSEVDEELRRVRTEAEEQAEALRRSAWEASTELLEHAVDTRHEMAAAAQQDTMVLRADAEHEADRLTNDARRIREEATRDAREDAERILAAARGEADAILAAATREAEAAQYRAQALEARRVELLAELEAAQMSIGGRDRVTAGSDEGLADDAAVLEEVEVAASEPASVDAPFDEENFSHWGPDEAGSVRVVSGNRVIRTGSVDADALAAEVQALRERDTTPEPEEPGPPAMERERELEPESQPEPAPGFEPVATADSEAERTSEPEPEAEAEPEREPRPAPDPEREQGIEAESRRQATLGTNEEAASPAGSDALAGLFASLRSPPPVSETAAGRGNGSGAMAPSAREPPAPVVVVDVDPFVVRDRALLPIQNRALRNVKRQLVELQNRALGGLRADEQWDAGEDFFDSAIQSDLSVLVRESTAAGIVAAAELTGVATTSLLGDISPVNPTGDFVAALAEAVASALARSRFAEAGSRETAATVSRVFRAWRTDEAERRMRAASFASYHGALVAASEAIGLSRFVVESAGHACPECPAGRGAWEIAIGPPPGTSMPPAHLDCTCALVPMG